ncbi:carbohydrate ABC transporter permease [Sphingomonas sp. PAMC 26605]|uniref:carbohydrate ABC transporter permease n=1 Tax=Sphingomonas sp. PAMC 26605 TaxID=1112214 RepID=UPI00026CA234|nr:sugar ABC transporter permease [Sphingomonas sp. PAMC 26605]
MTQSRKRAYGRRIALLSSGPALFGLTLFLIIPFLMAFALTFTDQRLVATDSGRFVGWRNYERLLSISYVVQDPQPGEQGKPAFARVRDVTRADPVHRGFRPFSDFSWGQKRVTILAKDPVFLESLLNTFGFALMVVPLQCAMALALALLVNAGLRGQTFLRAVYFSPVVMSMVVVSIVWTFLFDRDLGSINKLLSLLSLGTIGPVNWLGDRATAMPAIALMSAWQGAGFQMLIFLAGLQGISQELYDAARIDGATAWQRFWNVTIPGLRQTIAFVLVVTAIAALGLFTQVDVMTQGGPQNGTSTVMFHAIQRGVREENIAYGSTVAVVYFAIITVLILAQQALQRRWSK